ncbi:MAG: ileS, partial [Anaerospora sp.]|nr:ileS [Anaerospora sp.]
DTLVRLVSPVLTFSAEEVWQHMPKVAGMPQSIQLAEWPVSRSMYLDKQLEEKWNKLLSIRSELTKALEQARRTKVIGHSLDAAIVIYASGEIYEQLKALGEELATLLIVSKASVTQGDQQAPDSAYRSSELPLAVVVTPAQGEKCERCWIYSDTIGTDTEHSTLCERCASVLKA